MRNIVLMIAVGLVLFGCNKKADVADNAEPKFTVNFAFKAKNKCQGPFPEVALSNVPQGTASLEFKMIDLSYNNYDHGTSSVSYAGGNVLPEGAVGGLLGPCFSGTTTHQYRVTVKALAQDGQVLGVARVNRNFSN